MTKQKIVGRISALCFMMALAHAQGAVYYVSTQGSDSNPGSSSQPFRTITHAYSLAGPGVTIIVAPGTYTDYSSGWGLHLGANGTASAPIVLQSQVRGGAVINGQNATDRNEAIYIDGSYNVVQGFGITGGPNGGISIWGNGNQILDNEIYNNGNPASTSSNGHDGVYDDQSTSGNVYIGNYIHDNGRTGGSNLDHGLYLCGDNEVVYNNVMVRNDASGLQIAGYSTVSNLRVYNNVMAWNGTSGIILWQALSGISIQNNIVYQNGHDGIAFYAATGSGVVINDNLVFGNGYGNYDFTGGSSTASYSLGSTISVDPQFANDSSSGFDAHLSAGSPAILAGLNLSSYFTTDLAGTARPATGSWDLGAYVYQGTATTLADTTPPTVGVSAPASGATVSGTAVSVSATASDDGTVASVQFQLDGANLGSAVTTAPYAVSWNTTGVSNGSHVLTAIATDGVGLKATSAPVTVSVNNTTTTTSGLTFAATSGAITAPFAVTSSGTIVQPSYTGVTAGGQAVYKFSIGTAGDYVVSALVNAPDTGANSFFVNIDAQPTDPTMIWDVPVTSGLVSETVDWRGAGTADSTSPSGFDDQFTPKVFTLSAGTHQLIVRGREGNCQLGTITVAPAGTLSGVTSTPPPADTTPPTVAITSPANGATISGTAVVLSATAADDGTVASVQFQWDGANVSSALTVAPYSLTVDTTTAANGSHTVTAIATDGAGLKTTSAPITVTVSNAPPPAPSTLTFAATSGVISAPFAVTSSGTIVQPSYTGVTAGGQAVYTFTISVAGDYLVSALVNAPNTSANSFFVNIDAQPSDPTMIWDVPLTSGLQSQTVAWRGNGTTSSTSSSGFNDQYTPKVFTLSAGTHQLIVRGREGNCQLGTITIAPTSL